MGIPALPPAQLLEILPEVTRARTYSLPQNRVRFKIGVFVTFETSPNIHWSKTVVSTPGFAVRCFRFERPQLLAVRGCSKQKKMLSLMQNSVIMMARSSSLAPMAASMAEAILSTFDQLLSLRVSCGSPRGSPL